MMLFLAVVLGLLLRGMTSEERARLGRVLLAILRLVKDTAIKTPAGCEAFEEALRARTKWALVTPAIAAVQVLVYFYMFVGGADFADPHALVDWGASIGPRTTNGEWWRLATAMFVHWGLLHMLIEAAALLQAGLLMERLVGPSAFAVVYAASGLLAALWGLSAHPVSVSAGAAGAVFGVYGLLLASLVWGLVERSPLTMPLRALKRLWPGAAAFALYNMLSEGFLSESMQAGLVVGFVSGMVMAGKVSAQKPPARRVYAALAATIAIVVVSAAPLRGLADVTGEVARVNEAETRTASAYETAVERFKSGRLTAEGLAQLADQIASELQPLRTHLNSIEHVPAEHQPALTAASEYVRLREDSWRLRAKGLRAGHMRTLQQADSAEIAALAALEKTAPASEP
jgi:rhomboid protease GluP